MTGFDFPVSPGRIAMAGDWHANTSYGVRAIKWAAKSGAEAIVHVGDFGYRFSDRFLQDLTNELRRHDMRLMFVDGNHDNHDWLANQPLDEFGVRPLTERIAHLPRAFTWYWGQKRWMALGGAHSVDRPHRLPGVEWWSGEMLTLGEVDAAIRQGKVDYLVTHDAPSAATLPGVTRESAIRNGIDAAELDTAEYHASLVMDVVNETRPSRMWCGHFHQRADVDVPRLDGGATLLTVLDKDGSPFEWNMQIVDLSDDYDNGGV